MNYSLVRSRLVCTCPKMAFVRKARLCEAMSVLSHVLWWGGYSEIPRYIGTVIFQKVF